MCREDKIETRLFSEIFVFSVNSVCNANKLTYAPFLEKFTVRRSRLFAERERERRVRSKRRAINDRSTGERKFSEGKRTGAKSKSGKELMSSFRSGDIESQKSCV